MEICIAIKNYVEYYLRWKADFSVLSGKLKTMHVWYSIHFLSFFDVLNYDMNTEKYANLKCTAQ